MNLDRLNAARKHYEGIAAEAEVTIEVYLTNAAGIGEHPQHIDEVNKQIERIAAAKEKLDVLDEFEPEKAVL